MGAAGWAVNEDYYGEGAKFVVGNDKEGMGCLMLSGSMAAYFQDRIKNQGKDIKSELLKAVTSAEKVKFHEFLQ